MNITPNEAEWVQSSEGNYSRIYRGYLLVVGTEDGKVYWASINGRFLKEKFQAFYEAQDTVDARVGANDGRFWWR